MTESLPPWVEDALAGVFILRNVDEDRATRIVRTAISNYKFPELGGLDMMRPNDAGEAWLLLGRWTACFEADVQGAATQLRAALTRAAELDATGITFEGDGYRYARRGGRDHR